MFICHEFAILSKYYGQNLNVYITLCRLTACFTFSKEVTFFAVSFESMPLLLSTFASCLFSFSPLSAALSKSFLNIEYHTALFKGERGGAGILPFHGLFSCGQLLRVFILHISVPSASTHQL